MMVLPHARKILSPRSRTTCFSLCMEGVVSPASREINQFECRNDLQSLWIVAQPLDGLRDALHEADRRRTEQAERFVHVHHVVARLFFITRGGPAKFSPLPARDLFAD